MPLEAPGLELLKGKTVCALLKDSNVSIDELDPPVANMQGQDHGTLAFEVLDVTANAGGATFLPDAEIRILDAEVVCEQVPPLGLFTKAPLGTDP